MLVGLIAFLNYKDFPAVSFPRFLHWEVTTTIKHNQNNSFSKHTWYGPFLKHSFHLELLVFESKCISHLFCNLITIKNSEFAHLWLVGFILINRIKVVLKDLEWHLQDSLQQLLPKLYINLKSFAIF